MAKTQRKSKEKALVVDVKKIKNLYSRIGLAVGLVIGFILGYIQ